MEKIIIKNFLWLNDIDYTLNNFNIITWKQWTWKSILIKLISFFKNIPNDIISLINEEAFLKTEIESKLRQDFIKKFPEESWGDAFEICYSYSIKDDKELYWKIIWNWKKIKFENSINFIDIAKKIFLKNKHLEEKNIKKNLLFAMELREKYWKKLRDFWILEETVIFIPAWRSFFSTIDSNIYDFLSAWNTIDPYMVDFWKFYNTIKKILADKDFPKKPSVLTKEIDDFMKDVISLDYVRVKGKDYFKSREGKLIKTAYSSSWEQEILPIFIILKALTALKIDDKVSVFIEEPEAHLFPTAQKLIVDLLSLVFNSNKGGYSFFITTHSPYVLSSFNNLFYASELNQKYWNNELITNKINLIIKENSALNTSLVSAIWLNNWLYKSILDKETNLIDSSYLDWISDEIMNIFSRLTDIDYGS